MTKYHNNSADSGDLPPPQLKCYYHAACQTKIVSCQYKDLLFSCKKRNQSKHEHATSLPISITFDELKSEWHIGGSITLSLCDIIYRGNLMFKLIVLRNHSTIGKI